MTTKNPFGPDFEEEDQAEPKSYNYTFFMRSGKSITETGYLVVTANFTAIGFGGRGEIKLVVPMGELLFVTQTPATGSPLDG